MWGAATHWLEYQTLNRKDQGWNPPDISLGYFVHPHIACLLDETLKAVSPFYMVPMPGEVKDPT